MNRPSSLAGSFLAHLGLEARPPTLEFLHEVVREHQLRVPFETLTKILDYDRLHETGSFMPEIGDYVTRLREAGTGGTCWTLARGFHWLLGELGFDPCYLYMDPGHVCLAVELDRPYYVDVGYSAPLFRAYPLRESFVANSAREQFTYAVGEDSVVVTREPGPRKVLDMSPRTFDELSPHFDAANEWRDRAFLTRLTVFRYVDGAPTQLFETGLRRFLDGGVEEQELSEKEVLDWLERECSLDPGIYLQARRLRAKWLSHHGLEAP